MQTQLQLRQVFKKVALTSCRAVASLIRQQKKICNLLWPKIPGTTSIEMCKSLEERVTERTHRTSQYMETIRCGQRPHRKNVKCPQLI
jgi:hypothetical protein